MKKRYTEEQIIKAIKEHEAGAKVDDICRRLNVSAGTFYNWRSKSLFRINNFWINGAVVEFLGTAVRPLIVSFSF